MPPPPHTHTQTQGAAIFFFELSSERERGRESWIFGSIVHGTEGRIFCRVTIRGAPDETERPRVAGAILTRTGDTYRWSDTALDASFNKSMSTI